MSKPFIRWAGSKKQVLPILAKFWSENSRYIEPFAGSAQLFYYLNPQRAILSDINRDLIDTYRAIKRNPLAVHRSLIKMPTGKENYYRIRSLDPRSLDLEDMAARFIYLNRFCFNGLYRTNLKGEFNVPYSGYKTGDLPSQESLINASIALKRVKIVKGDFESVIINNLEAGDFVYLDPPYAIKNKRIFNQYDPQSFGLNDIERLTRLLNHINKCKAKFLLSYAYDKEMREVFSKWTVKSISIQRNISGFKKDQRMSKELLITNVER